MLIQRLTVFSAIIIVTAVVYALFFFKLYDIDASQEKNIYIVLKTNNVRSDFWQTVSAGAQAAAKENGATLTIQGPLQESDTETQVKLLQDALQQNPSAVIVAPINDERILTAIENIRQAKIPLVIIDTPINLSSPPVSVTSNHLEAGQLAGLTIAIETNDQPCIVIISDFIHSSISMERERGIKQALLPYTASDLGTFYAADSEDRSYLLVKTLLTNHPELNAIVTFNEAATLGAAKAIKELKAERIKLIGFDSSIYTIQLLEEGILKAIIVQKPFNMGYLGVKTAFRLVDGGSSAPFTYTDSSVVTRDNMYTPENQKLLFPFNNK